MTRADHQSHRPTILGPHRRKNSYPERFQPCKRFSWVFEACLSIAQIRQQFLLVENGSLLYLNLKFTILLCHGDHRHADGIHSIFESLVFRIEFLPPFLFGLDCFVTV